MELKELASTLGIDAYPDKLEEIYKNLSENDSLFCYEEHIKNIQKEYDVFGDYYDHVFRAAQDLKNRQSLFIWARIAYTYAMCVSRAEAAKMPFPPSDGTLTGDMLPLLVIIRMIPEAVKRYTERGFCKEQIKKNLENIKINLWVHEITKGFVGLNQGLYGWLTYYMKAEIFDHKGFNYQLEVWPDHAMVLKNKSHGEYAIVMLTGSFDKNGLVLGSVGAEDTEGSFDADFKEYTDSFLARPVTDGYVEHEIKRFEKTEWEVVLRPGDDVLSLHIPRNTNLEPDYVSESFKEGLALARKHYPERFPKCIVCTSWLMEPRLVKILGNEARLSKFTTRFIKYPVKDVKGTSCFSYLWPGDMRPVAQRAEQTRLQRGVKKIMENGDYIRTTAGIIVDDL